MLVTPTLEWQDHLSGCYAVTDKPCTPDSPGSRSSPQRRRLDKDSATPVDWDRLYKFEPADGTCGTRPQSDGLALIIYFLIAESDDPDDAASLVGELSLDENKEVRVIHNYLTKLDLNANDRCDTTASSVGFICYTKLVAQTGAGLGVSGG